MTVTMHISKPVSSCISYGDEDNDYNNDGGICAVQTRFIA